MISRNLGFKMSNNEIKKLKPEDTGKLFDCSNLVFMANNSLAAIAVGLELDLPFGVP